MYKLCKTEQSAARQRELEQGLLNAMREMPYDEISISDLCKQIGIPRKAFYRYFSGKEGALHALIDHTLMEFEAFTAPHAARSRRSKSDLESFFVFWQQKKPMLDALERSGLSGVLIERAISQALSDMVGSTGRFLRQEERMEREQATMFGVCGLMSMMVQWHHKGCDTPPVQMASIAARLLTQPLFANIDP